MRAALVAVGTGAVVMAMSITWGFVAGDGWAELRKLVALPWGVVSLIDVYIGFFLIAGWVWFREPSRWRAGLWTLSFMALGNLATCVYALIALLTCRGDWSVFWMGHRTGRR